MKASKSKTSPRTKELSVYISRAIKKALPREVSERAKVHLIDTVASMISGSRLVPG